MRQVQRQEVLSIINGLQQAHGEIRAAMEKKDKTSAETMLAECQEFAIELGEAIEKTEGEGCATISHLEKYCEVLFSVFQELNLCTVEGVSGNANKFYKTLKKYLLRVENSVKNDISICKEVVFFPYKASMWDSLESVYYAAKQDSDCEVYCVLIPYFDLNADHSFGTMHYEGHEYPKNVEIIDWKTYDFEERRPDIVFIHNPYDEWNHVTSVHPRYYAKNLKNYTSCLVYIPYFILKDIERDDPDREYKIDNMKHFCFAPGTIYANKIIVQSEEMRQIYITEYLNEAKQLNIPVTRKELEKRILGIGSPKIDKVLNTRTDDLEIPEQWKEIIRRSDGEHKKIILYNTGVSSLLAHGDKWIDKIEDVLCFFRRNKEELALLWRPHPLIENTLKSMRPELLQRYLAIKDRYIVEDWGIYDNTPELDRAMVISDAYYGDGSSIVQLYQKTGKAIMIQDVDILYGQSGDVCED